MATVEGATGTLGGAEYPVRVKIRADQVGREREPEHFGPYALSVQASSAHFCDPRVDGLPLSEYASFEVVLMHRTSGRNLAPSDAGLDPGFDRHWNLSHPTCASAPFLPASVVDELREALRNLCVDDPTGDA